MKVPSKTPKEMLEFWEAELAKLEEEERLGGITLWGRNFLKAKIQLWQEVVDVQTERSRKAKRKSSGSKLN